jgi:inhibitor of the pro-sigma K processing machinery
VELSGANLYIASVLVLLTLRVLAGPLLRLLRLLLYCVAGGLALWAVNQVGGPMGFHIGLNPVSAAVVGLLGIPGLLGLSLLRLILG